MGIPPSTFQQSGWGILRRNLTHRPCVGGHDDVAVGRRDHENPGGPRRQRSPGMPMKPLCLLLRTALEVLEAMLSSERFRYPVAQPAKGDSRSSRARRPGSSRAGRSFKASHSSRASAGNENLVRSASTRWAATTRLVSANSVSVPPSASTARSISRRVSGEVRNSTRSVLAREVVIATPSLYGQCTASGQKRQGRRSRRGLIHPVEDCLGVKE